MTSTSFSESEFLSKSSLIQSRRATRRASLEPSNAVFLTPVFRADVSMRFCSSYKAHRIFVVPQSTAINIFFSYVDNKNINHSNAR